MATYEQGIKAYTKDLRVEERALRQRDPEAYGRIGMYKPIVNILINSVNELNLSKQELYTAMRKGPRGIQSYIGDHKEYIRDQVIRNVKKLSGQMYRRFDKLLKLINKYEKTIEKQDKKIDKQEKKIGGLEKKIKKDAKKLKQADKWQHKADTLDARIKVAKDYRMSANPPLDRDVMKYLRGR